MSLFGLFGPKWKSKNPDVRLTAVQNMGAQDLDTLHTLAAGDEDPRVRLAAVERIEERGVLEDLATRNLGSEALEEVRTRLQRLWCDALLDGSPGEDAEALLERIDEPSLLTRLAVEAPTPALRVGAVGRIDDQETLCAVVEQNCGKEPGRAALARISDSALLQRVAQNAASKVTRRLATEKLAPPADVPTPSAPPGRAAEGEPLQAPVEEPVPAAADTAAADAAAEAEVALLAQADREKTEAREEVISAVEALVGSQAENATQEFQAARGRWAAVGAEPPADDSLSARYADACRRFEEAQQALEGERRQLSVWEEQLAEAQERVTDDPGLADRSLADLAAQIQAAGLRVLDPAPLLTRASAAREDCTARRAQIAAARSDAALEQRETLSSELEALAEAEDRAAAGQRAKDIAREWKRLPPVSGKQQARALEERFRAAREQFKVSQAPYLEQQEWQRWANRTKLEALCTEVEALDEEDDLATVAERVKQAQKRWKEIGPAPRADSEVLWQRFKTACDRNFERCKPHFDELAAQRAATAERKEELCLRAEEHVESTSWKESAEALKALQAEWKEAGKLPRKKDQALYTRFRHACDRFFERRQEHFAELDEKRRGNQEEKEKLCEQAESLADAPQREYVKEFRDLQGAWKRAGPAPRATEEELWQRFRAAADRFFAWLDEGRLDNLHQKEQLCDEVETLVAGAAEDADPQQIAGQIADLQNRWKEIGPVPKEHSDLVWERFRKPCDAFFASREEQFAKLEAGRRDNEDRKLELLHRAEDLADGGAAEEASETLKQLQGEWNALGPASREREPELQGRFTALCDEFFAGRHQPSADQEGERRENMKRKEALCVQLERVVGTAATAVGTGENTALSLAEQLQLAFASNFALAGDQDTPERRLEEVRRIQEQWRGTGPVPREHDRAVWARYRALLEAFYADSNDSAQRGG